MTQAALVQGAGNELFSRTAFAVDEHGSVRRGNERDLVEHAEQRRTVADHFLEAVLAADLFLQVDVLGMEPILE